MDNSTKNGIITIAALAVAGVIVWKLLKNPTNNSNGGGGNNGGGSNGDGDNGEDNGEDNGGDNGGGENPPPSPTQTDLTGNQVMKIANDIFEAMDGYGTNEENIIDSFKKIKTNNDMDNLVSAFGTRTVSSGTGNIFVSDFTGNLVECLRDELDEDDISEINTILRNNRVSRSI
jgi:hypothetical protein